MTIEEYKIEANQIKDKLKTTNEQIFNPEFSPYLEEYLLIFKFYKSELTQQAYYGYNPSIIYINTNLSVNAKAGIVDDSYFISINMGLIQWTIEKFKLNEDLIENQNFKLFKILQPRLDLPINVLMYQAALHFTFYHELAHLVQKTELLKESIEERPLPSSGEFLFERHMLEMDADQFSSLYIGTHILEYAKRIFGQKLNKPQVESILIILVLPVFLYILSFQTDDTEMYYKSKTHPHPINRVMNIVLTVTHYFQQSLKQEGMEVEIDPIFIVKMVFEYAKEMELNFYGQRIVNKFLQILSVQQKDIALYLYEFEQYRKDNPNMAVYQWNYHKGKK